MTRATGGYCAQTIRTVVKGAEPHAGRTSHPDGSHRPGAGRPLLALGRPDRAPEPHPELTMAIQEAVRAPIRINPSELDGEFRPRRPENGWVSKATCRGSTHLFFAPNRERPGRRARREAAARALCAACPVLLPCRDWARANREYGFWGGESEDERAAAGYRPVLASGFALRAQSA